MGRVLRVMISNTKRRIHVQYNLVFNVATELAMWHHTDTAAIPITEFLCQIPIDASTAVK